ncbi:hypothetical protein RvY_09293 [Ramazzottius varieornatus]|uniref:Uncharacterized protein n=1 Tax=Ramazzottius varieornatus TaxID=947166 RepID=A0A1D1VED4_RAMVA|nr:hypothetical protein RvY_09293 [Ramazzottius varieornatus]
MDQKTDFILHCQHPLTKTHQLTADRDNCAFATLLPSLFSSGKPNVADDAAETVFRASPKEEVMTRNVSSSFLQAVSSFRRAEFLQISLSALDVALMIRATP